MILYTPLSYDDVFSFEENSAFNHQVISSAGRTFYVRQTATEQYEILRLISTDPADFLEESFQPGQKLTLNEE